MLVPGCGVDGVPEEAVARHLDPDHARDAGPRVQPNPHQQLLLGPVPDAEPALELQTKVKQRFAKISQVHYDYCISVPISCLLTVRSAAV